jgi:drug/metabolite transporter (DMT)-like permease
MTARPILAAVLGAMAIASSGVLVRLSAESPTTVGVFRCLYALPALGLLAYLEDRYLGRRIRRDRLFAVLAGVFLAADLVMWHHSIGFVGAGLATVLGNLQVVVVALAAWAVLGERPHARLVVAAPIALTGVVMISGLLDEHAFGSNPGLGVVFGVLVSAAYAGFLLSLRRGGADTRRVAGPLFEATVVAAVGCAVVGAIMGDLDLVPSWPSHGWLITLALSSQVVGWLLISVSLPRLPAALTSVLLLIQPVGAVVLGMIVLGESPSPLQVFGVALVLAGVLVATARRQSAVTRIPPSAPGPESARQPVPVEGALRESGP